MSERQQPSTLSALAEQAPVAQERAAERRAGRHAGGPHFPKRVTDGRTRRSDRSRDKVAATVVEDIIEKAGDFQPKVSTIVARTGRYSSEIVRLFTRKRLMLTYIARTAPGRVVDAIGLDPETRARLSDREVRAIAWAVLAGRRLERGA